MRIDGGLNKLAQGLARGAIEHFDKDLSRAVIAAFTGRGPRFSSRGLLVWETLSDWRNAQSHLAGLSRFSRYWQRAKEFETCGAGEAA